MKSELARRRLCFLSLLATLPSMLSALLSVLLGDWPFLLVIGCAALLIAGSGTMIIVVSYLLFWESPKNSRTAELGYRMVLGMSLIPGSVWIGMMFVRLGEGKSPPDFPIAFLFFLLLYSIGVVPAIAAIFLRDEDAPEDEPFPGEDDDGRTEN